jgi:2-polyprenyl-6-methoxyphenol hydroxylase-like FAD-dependent oxidoreductase
MIDKGITTKEHAHFNKEVGNETDVFIAGVGPVGPTMASELARYGLSVRLIDKNSERTDKSKALVLWPRALELMDRRWLRFR